MQKRFYTLRFLMLATLVLLPHIASAQMVDYSGLEELFGEPVTTSATGQPQKASRAPVTMDIITADQIRRSGAENIAQVIGRLSGVVNWQESRSYADVGVRGQNYAMNPTLLVLINGRQIYIDSYGFTDWTLLPVQMEEIKQIEVVKGPNTALFGFNAVSGVVNIVTYNPRYDDTGNAGVKVGTDGYRKAHFLDTIKLSDKANVRVSGGLKEMQQYDLRYKTVSPGQTFTKDQEFSQLNLDSMFQLAEKTQMRFEASRSTGEAEDPAFYNFFANEKEIYSFKGSLTSATSLGLIEANLYQNTHKADYDSLGGLSVYNRITVAQLQDMFKVGNTHIFRVLGEARHNVFSSGKLVGEGADITYDALAASAMWNWSITPEWELTNAVRFDSLTLGRSGDLVGGVNAFPQGNEEWDQQTNAVSVNSGLVWKATDRDTYRISFARGVQAPSLYMTSEWINAGGVAAFTGNPRLQPAITNNYEIGYDRLIPQMEGKFRSAAFYKETRDVMAPNADFRLAGGFPVVESENIGKHNTIGFELGLNGKFLQNWDWDTSYSYQSTDNDYHAIRTHSFMSQDTVPHHMVKAHLGWANGPWEVDGYAQYMSDFEGTYAISLVDYAVYDIDSFFTSGARVSYTFDNDITLALSGVDISQTRVESGPGLENERQVFLSVSKKF